MGDGARRRPHGRPPTQVLIGSVLSIWLLVAAACGGGDAADDGANPEGSSSTIATAEVSAGPQTVTSEDGKLTVETSEIPEELTVEQLDQTDWPQALEGGQPLGAVYRLGPDGITFDEPVTVTLRLDRDALDVEGGAVPVVFLASLGSDGTWSLLDGHTASLDGDEMVVAATTTHFSDVAAFEGAVTVTVDPPSIIAAPGESWLATYDLDIAEGVDVSVFVESSSPHASGAVVVVEDMGGAFRFRDRFGCDDEPGTGSYGVGMRITEDLRGRESFFEFPSPGLSELLASEATSYTVATGQATCGVTQEQDDDSVAGDLQPLTPDAILGGSPVRMDDEEFDCTKSTIILEPQVGQETEDDDCDDAIDVLGAEFTEQQAENEQEAPRLDLSVGMAPAEFDAYWVDWDDMADLTLRLVVAVGGEIRTLVLKCTPPELAEANLMISGPDGDESGSENRPVRSDGVGCEPTSDGLNLWIEADVLDELLSGATEPVSATAGITVEVELASDDSSISSVLDDLSGIELELIPPTD